MSIYFRSALIVAMAALFSACSGGGGSSAAPTVSLTVNPLNLSVNEGQSTTFTVATSSGAKVSVSGGNIASIQKGTGNYLVTAGQVDRAVTETFTITASLSGYTSKSQDIKVVIENLSGADTEETTLATLNAEESIVSLEEDYNFFRAVVESMYLEVGLSEMAPTGTLPALTYSEKEAILSGFNPTNSAYHDVLSQSFDDLQETYNQYSQGQVSEDALGNKLNDIQFQIRQHSAYGATQIKPYFEAFYPTVDVEAMTQLEFSSEAGRYSRFVGNPEFGSYIDGEWVYEGDFTLLDTVIPNKNNNIGFCEA